MRWVGGRGAATGAGTPVGMQKRLLTAKRGILQTEAVDVHKHILKNFAATRGYDLEHHSPDTQATKQAFDAYAKLLVAQSFERPSQRASDEARRAAEATLEEKLTALVP